MREGIRLLLAKATDIEILGEARDGKEAVELASSLNPQVILMDIEMPGVDGLQATRQLKAAGHPAQILILSMHTEERIVRAAAESGAHGFLIKNIDRDELIGAIRSVHQGMQIASPSVACFFSSDNAQC
jgi:DNA-binding NarL/FixJ family response regulator